MYTFTRSGIVIVIAILISIWLSVALATPPNNKVNSSTGTDSLQNEEQIWINPRNTDTVVAVWRDFREGYRRVAVGYSVNAGSTWTDMLLDSVVNYCHSDPCLTANASGRFYITVMDFKGKHCLGGTQDTSTITVFSSENGVTWSDPVELFSSINDELHDKQFTTVDRTGGNYDGNYYVVWSRGTRILFCRSTDACSTFSDRDTIGPACSPTAYVQQAPIPIVDSDGDVHVFWHADSCSGSGYATRHTVSTNGGQSFSEPSYILENNISWSQSSTVDGGIRIYGMPLGDCDISGGTYDNNIYIARCQWVESAGGETDVEVRKSTNGGSSWSDPLIINDDGLSNIDQFHPWLVVNEDGVVLILFYDQRNDTENHTNFDAYFSASFDGGQTYIHNERISDTSSNPQYLKTGTRAGKIGEYIGIHANHDTVSAIWTDTRNQNQDVYNARFIIPFNKPRLYLPDDDDTTDNRHIYFCWSTCWHEDADSYWVEIASDTSFSNIVVDTGLTDNVFIMPEDLDADSTYYWRVYAIRTSDDSTTTASEVFSFLADELSYKCGDADGNDLVEVSDACYITQYTSYGGPPPDPYLSGDANCDSTVTTSDATYLVNYIFSSGPPPGDPDEDSTYCDCDEP